jgi:hypothetical protein
MTLDEAIGELLESETFKEAAKQDAKLRVYAGRIKKGGVKNNAAIILLQQFGYKIEVIKE